MMMNLNFSEAAQRVKDVVIHTPLQLNLNLSRKYDCNVYLKREDLQVVRSYKLRGAYNMMKSLSAEELKKELYVLVQGIMRRGLLIVVTRWE